MLNTDVAAIVALLERELWIVTAAAGPQRGGLIATFVTSASIVAELPRVLVGLARQHHTWQLIETSHAFGLHLIDEEHLDWVWRFGSRSGRDADKLAGLSLRTGNTGVPLLTDALAWMECRVEERMNTGDRTVYLAEVVAGRRQGMQPPLTARRMVELAPPERLRELKENLDHDAAVDAAAIQDWRRQRSS